MKYSHEFEGLSKLPVQYLGMKIGIQSTTNRYLVTNIQIFTAIERILVQHWPEIVLHVIRGMLSWRNVSHVSVWASSISSCQRMKKHWYLGSKCHGAFVTAVRAFSEIRAQLSSILIAGTTWLCLS